MNDIELITRLRKYISLYGLEELNDSKLRKVNIDPEQLRQLYNTREEIAERVLYYERHCFEEIFSHYCFDGWNAIDIMLMVSHEIDKHFFEVSPSITFNLSQAFPVIFDNHLLLRSAFIFDKIKINIEKGMEQGMYKKDCSSEMIARMYIAKLNDIHNPEIYSPESFTFATIFNNLIDDVIKTITNEEGRNYYKQRKQLYNILNFQ